MSKLINYSKGLARSSPFIINVMSFIFGVLFRQNIGIYYSIFSVLTDIMMHSFKNLFKNVIYNKKVSLPILGKGIRPNGAKYCGIFIEEDNLEGKSTSFGMPSGHSQFATMSATFWILYLINNFPMDYRNYISIIFVIIMGLGIMISRYILKCHTYQQIILGGLIGIITGYVGYYLWEYIN